MYIYIFQEFGFYIVKWINKYVFVNYFFVIILIYINDWLFDIILYLNMLLIYLILNIGNNNNIWINKYFYL